MPAEPPLLTDEFRSTLRECQRLYHAAGELCVRDHPQLIKTSDAEFLALMDDLCRGLLVKVFITIFKADWRWAPQEMALALELCRDLWNEKLTEQQLRPAIKHLMERETSLRWESLFRPFQKLPPLWDQIGALESVVLRLANLVAKADGKVHPNEVNEIRGIQEQLSLSLGHLSRRAPHTIAGQAATAQAVEEMRTEAIARTDVNSPTHRTKAPIEQKSPELRLAEALAELQALIGLETVKTEVQGLVNLLRLQEHRRGMDLPTATLSLHMVFTGNPGVGKTTVARLVGRVFSALGILKKGHLIETDRSGLVAEYAGQTGPKTNKMIDAALDGVLFIDEAYSLRAEDGDDPFGAEAVQTLLKRMEDDRQRLVVVLAGYPAPMERLLRSNPGLSSRFSRRLDFPDFDTVQLCRILALLCEQNQYTLPTATRAKLLLGFQYLRKRRDEHFGNGRLVRNLFENAIRRLANRIVSVAPLTRELLTTFESDDIVLEGVPENLWDEARLGSLRFRVRCPHCGKNGRLSHLSLGQRVTCRSCRQAFVAEWGKPRGA